METAVPITTQVFPYASEERTREISPALRTFYIIHCVTRELFVYVVA